MKVDFFFELLRKRGTDFFCGVPDSLLQSFCAYITDNVEKQKHIIAANEGNAIGLAAGYYLATQKPALVYMQNSGMGNCVNPLVSLVDPDVYDIPVLMLIGWRGEPGIKDEPQHKKQGKVTTGLLKALNIPYEILNNNENETVKSIDRAYEHLKSKRGPFALIIKKSYFDDYSLQKIKVNENELSREEAVKIIMDNLNADEVIVSTTGKVSRELFEYRELLRQGHEKDFLTVGSMGHASQIAMGIAIAKPEREVYCFDGDGAAIMHMGALAIIGTQNLPNFKHIIFNNYAHDSVGGQPTVGGDIDFCGIAASCHYRETLLATGKKQLNEKLPRLKDVAGPALLEVRISKGARSNLGRPTTSPVENKNCFMNFLSND